MRKRRGRSLHDRHYGRAGYAALDRYRREVKDWARPGPDGMDGRHSYTPEQVEFMTAMDAEKRRLGVVALTPRQILAVARRLGYRRDA